MVKPPKKQSKIAAIAQKTSTPVNPEENTDGVIPMEDVDVHVMTQQEKQAYEQQQNNSNNNQQLNQTESHDDDEETLIAANEPPPLTFTRCDMKINIEGKTDNNYLDALRNIQNFFSQIKKEDEYAQIGPWKENSTQPNLATPDEIPSDEDNAADYFKGLNPRDDKPGQQQLWFKIRIGHSVEMDDLRRSINRYLSRHKWTLTTLMLQVERTTCVGMFQYSHGNMDFPHLARGIEKVIKIPVQLRWRVISKGWQAGQMANADKIRAIHVEVDAKVARKALELLSTNFGKSKSTLPGGRRMRFFPEINRVRSQDNQNKILEMRKRQGIFLDTIEKSYSNDIHLLDKQIIIKDKDDKVEKTIPTLRSMIQAIYSFQPGMDHLQLFHSVDVAWSPRGQDRGHCFLVMPHLRVEGSIMIRNLLPYLRFKYGPEVEKYFTQECVDANEGVVWDDVNKCVISTIETNLKDDDGEDDFIGLDMALKYVQDKKDNDSSTQPATDTTNSSISRPTPLASANPTQKIVDAPIIHNAVGNEYYRQEDDISSIGMSATNTFVDGSVNPNKAPITRPTLGSLQGTVIQPSSLKPQAPSSVFHPITISQDAQTTASSVTMESMMQRFEQRDARQDKMMENMMKMVQSIAQSTQSAQQSPSLGKAGDKW